MIRRIGMFLVALVIVASGLFGPVAGNSPSDVARADAYPYADAAPYHGDYEWGTPAVDPWGFYKRNCTSYVAWRLRQNGVDFTNTMAGGRFGNAHNWDNNARSLGYQVDSVPEVGSVAVWEGTWGHVAYVTGVNPDGTVNVAEYNKLLDGNYGSRNGVRADSYIHIKDVAPSSKDYRRSILRDGATGASFLIRDDGKRYAIPSGGDFEAMKANGVPVYTVSRSEIDRYPDSRQQAKVVRVDDPNIGGPAKWLRWVGGVGGAAFDGDFVWTTSAAGKSYVTNTGYWDLNLPSPGLYRLKCYIPNRSEAWAGVVYKVLDGNTAEFSKSITQASHVGWVTLGQAVITSGVVKIQLPDNLGSGPYNAKFAYDACEAVPIG